MRNLKYYKINGNLPYDRKKTQKSVTMPYERIINENLRPSEKSCFYDCKYLSLIYQNKLVEKQKFIQIEFSVITGK